MSFSDEYSKYYLTDEGWICVYTKNDFHEASQNCSVPEKYYMICKYRELYSSPFSQVDKKITVEFQKEDESDKINELIKKFGECPHLI